MPQSTVRPVPGAPRTVPTRRRGRARPPSPPCRGARPDRDCFPAGYGTGAAGSPAARAGNLPPRDRFRRLRARTIRSDARDRAGRHRYGPSARTGRSRRFRRRKEQTARRAAASPPGPAHTDAKPGSGTTRPPRFRPESRAAPDGGGEAPRRRAAEPDPIGPRQASISAPGSR